MHRFKRDGQYTQMWMSAVDTKRWAQRPGKRWPGSQLAGHRVYAKFEKGDLVDLKVDGKYNFHVSADEFNAMSSDALRARFGPSHPAIRVSKEDS